MGVGGVLNKSNQMGKNRDTVDIGYRQTGAEAGLENVGVTIWTCLKRTGLLFQ